MAVWVLGDRDRARTIEVHLTSLDIAVVEEGADVWTLDVPAYRSDVTRPADVAEEVLRIHGFDRVPLPERMTGTLEVPSSPNREDVLFGWRELLVGRGFTEIMSNSLTKASYAELVKDGDLVPDASVHMLNPLSSDLGVMRQSLVFQGLEAIARNANHQQPDLRLFEFGRTYTRHDHGDGGSTTSKRSASACGSPVEIFQSLGTAPKEKRACRHVHHEGNGQVLLQASVECPV